MLNFCQLKFLKDRGSSSSLSCCGMSFPIFRSHFSLTGKWSLPRVLSSTFHELMLARDGETMERSKWEIFPVWVSILVPDPSLISTELYLSIAVSINLPFGSVFSLPQSELWALKSPTRMYFSVFRYKKILSIVGSFSFFAWIIIVYYGNFFFSVINAYSL